MGAARKKKTAKRKATGSAARALVRPLVEASAAQKAKWREREKEILALRARGADAFDELYEAVHEVISADPPLYLAGGMRSERELFARVLPGEDERTIKRNVLVAVCFTPADEERKGIAFLEKLALYEQERSGSRGTPRAIDLGRMRVSWKEGSRVVRKRAIDCSAEEIERARDALAEAGGGKGKRAKVARRTASPAEAAIARALPKRKALAGIEVRVAGEEASFRGVPLAELASFGKALGNVELPG